MSRATVFRQALAEAHLPDKVPSDIRLLSGIDGDTVFEVHTGADKLARQIQQTVDWASCMESCRAAGITKAVELLFVLSPFRPDRVNLREMLIDIPLAGWLFRWLWRRRPVLETEPVSA